MPTASEFRDVPQEALRFDVGPCEFAEPAAESKTAPVKLVARTGKAILHWYWGQVIHDLAGMRLHKSSLPIDYAHYDNEVLGYLDTFETDSGDLVASGQLVPFTHNDRASEVLHKAKSGVPYEASIFFSNPLRIEDVGDGAETQVNGYTVRGPATIFREWGLRGVAICPYGADPNTKTVLADRSETVRVEIHTINPETSEMASDNAAAESTQPTPEQLAEVMAEAVTTPEPEQLAEPPEAELAAETEESAAPDDPRAECKRFVDAFGTQGATWFCEGKTYEEAQSLHTKQLAAENEQLKKQLGAVQLGEAEPVSFADGEAPVGKSGTDPLALRVGESTARIAAGIKFARKAAS